MWKLTIEDDEGKRTPLPLLRDEYTIGRADENSIRLTERNISRRHAGLRRRDAFWWLVDCDSTNGSYINGIRVEAEARLEHNDVLQLGDYRVEVLDESKLQLPDPLTDLAVLRPDRLVVVQGPVPGQEFEIRAPSMLIGRATEVEVSIPQISVSRVHAEVHALGGGRYEIIDKGSANGVRINGSLLDRALIEAGDYIELGEVRLKFVGAGQVYWPGAEAMRLSAEPPDLSTGRPAAVQLSAPEDLETELVLSRRGSRRSGALVATMLVLAGGIGLAVFAGRSALSQRFGTPARASAQDTKSPERTAIEEAQRLAASGHLDAAHARIAAAVASTSPLRESTDVRGIEGRWADSILARAEQEADPARRRALFASIAQSTTVDSFRRLVATDKLRDLDEKGTETSALPPAAKSAPATATSGSHPPRTAVLATDPWASDAPERGAKTTGETGRGATKGTVEARETESSLRAALESKLASGRASADELRQLVALCQRMGDRTCSERAAAQLSAER